MSAEVLAHDAENLLEAARGAQPRRRESAVILLPQPPAPAGTAAFDYSNHPLFVESAMSLNLYDLTIPALARGLSNLSALLDKAAAHAESRKFDSQVLVQARLFPDMHPLLKQVQIACDTAKGAAARLAGLEPPAHPDTETNLAELKARIAKTLEFVNSIQPAQLQGAEDRAIEMKTPRVTLHFTGRSYLSGFVLPNFYFHSSMVYALLRHSGVEIGKMDFLGPIT
jgi:hypothetical protein